MPTVSNAIPPKLQFFSAAGVPLVGGKLYSYAAGTSTPLATYTDNTGNTANANPVILDSRGEASVWLAASQYKLVLTDANDVQVWSVDGLNAPDTATLAALAANNGSSLVGFIQTGTGAVARTVQAKLRDAISVKDFGAVGDGVTNDSAALQNALNNAKEVFVPSGSYLISEKIEVNYPDTFSGTGAPTLITTTAGFPASEIFEIFHAPGVDPKGWTIENLLIANNGSATHAFTMNVSTFGSYISKFTLRNIISKNQVSSYFFELINTVPQVDGFFTSYISDNWSLGGYYLDNVGDSVFLERNTTSGAGRGYYVNQLPTASHVVIRDGNCTSAGGALFIAQGYNVSFDNMQVECPVTFTGSNNALVSANSSTSELITNLRITNNNINAQTANPTVDCIYLQDTQNAVIDGNTLYCHPSSGQHIVIDTNARDTYIGSNNSYFSSTTGADIAARIVDNGIGTRGIWKNASLTTSWTLVDPTNGFPVGFYKDIDGNVSLRGNLAGAAPGAPMVVFTLPVGFRPNTKTLLFYLPYNTTSSCAVQIEPTGVVTMLTTAATGVYFDGVSFSTK